MERRGAYEGPFLIEDLLAEGVRRARASIFVSDVAHGRLSRCSMDSPTPMHIKTELRELSGL